MLWMLSCKTMTWLSVGRCNRIVWDTKENMTKWWKNPKGDDILAIILLQVISYFVWYRPVYTPHVHALMRDSNMIEVSIIHTHSPSTYFLLYVLLCCSVSHYSPQLILSVSAKVQFKKIVLRKSRGSTSNLLSIIQICVSELQPPMTGWRDLHSRMDQ